MLATQTCQKMYSVVPLKDKEVQVVSVTDLPVLVQQNPDMTVYLLWPEHKDMIAALTPAKVYVLGEEPYDMEQMKAAIKAGAEDYLDRKTWVEPKQTVTEVEDQVIRLAPRFKQSDVKITPTNESQFPSTVGGIEEPAKLGVTPVVESVEPEPVMNYSRFDDLHRKPIGGRQTIVVTSTKGGIGKTTVAMNIARLLHDSDRGRVILLDLMHPHGNVSTRMKIQCDVNVKSWEPYMERNASLTDQQIMNNLVIKSPNGMYILPSVNPGEECSPELVDYILLHLNKVFDFVIIDIGPERQELLTRAMTTATKTILVVDYDLATIKDTLDYADVWHKRQLSLDKINVIVNFEPIKKDGNSLTREKCKDYLNQAQLKIIGFLPETQGMRSIHNKGKLIVQEDAKNPFTKEMDAILGRLVLDYKSKEKVGFFKRLFGK